MEQLMFVHLGVIEACSYELKPELRAILKILYPYSGWHYSLLKDGARNLLKDNLKLSEEDIKKVEFLTNHDGHGNQWGVLIHQDTVIGEFGHQLWLHPFSEAHLEQSYVSQAHHRIDHLRERRKRLYHAVQIGMSSFWSGIAIATLALHGPWFQNICTGIVLTIAVPYIADHFVFHKKHEEEFTELEHRQSIKNQFAFA